MNRKKRSPIWKLPVDDFQKLIDESLSLREALRFFNLESKGGNYNTFKKGVKRKVLIFLNLKEILA